MAIENLEDAFSIERSRPHGHVAAVLGTIKNLELDKIICPQKSRERQLVMAMIVARIIRNATVQLVKIVPGKRSNIGYDFVPLTPR